MNARAVSAWLCLRGCVCVAVSAWLWLRGCVCVAASAWLWLCRYPSTDVPSWHCAAWHATHFHEPNGCCDCPCQKDDATRLRPAIWPMVGPHVHCRARARPPLRVCSLPSSCPQPCVRPQCWVVGLPAVRLCASLCAVCLQL